MKILSFWCAKWVQLCKQFSLSGASMNARHTGIYGWSLAACIFFTHLSSSFALGPFAIFDLSSMSLPSLWPVSASASFSLVTDNYPISQGIWRVEIWIELYGVDVRFVLACTWQLGLHFKKELAKLPHISYVHSLNRAWCGGMDWQFFGS
jgi:hypothetical protein